MSVEGRYIIVSELGFWNKSIGWVDHNDDATTFTEKEKSEMELKGFHIPVKWEPVLYIPFEAIKHVITEEGSLGGNQASSTKPGSVPGKAVQGTGGTDSPDGKPAKDGE